MKKFIILFTYLWLPFISNAQISITSDELIGAGDSIFLSVDKLPNNTLINPSGSGYQTWDFTSLEEQSIDSVFLFHADETPYFSSFPTSNISALVLPDSIFMYITKNETGLYQNGAVGDFTNNGQINTVTAVDPFLMIALPANYTDMIKDTAVNELVSGSVKFNQTIFSKDTIDAYGELSIPAGTYSALRKFRESINIDSIFTLFMGNWIFVSSSTDTVYEYSWWTDDAEVKFFLCSFSYDIDADTITSNINFVKEVRMSNVYTIPENAAYLVYPNPNKGIFSIKGNLQKINSVEVIDYSGKITEFYYDYSDEIRIDISKHPAGMYFLRIRSEDGYETFKVISTP